MTDFTAMARELAHEYVAFGHITEATQAIDAALRRVAEEEREAILDIFDGSTAEGNAIRQKIKAKRARGVK